MRVLSTWRGAAVAAVTILVSTYTVGHMIGRATEPATAPPAPAAEPSPPADPPAGEEKPVRAMEDPGSSRAAATQPFTGPGRPPLPRSSGGPHGSRRTTGAEYVALTFDDGPDPRFTPEVLSLLSKHGATATFCVVGQLAEAYPELIRDIVADGHTMCNHSWNHDIGLGTRSRAEIRRDLERTTAAIQAAAPGTRVSYYRQPGGAWTRRMVDVAEELGMTSLHWAVDPQDWRRPGAGAIAAEIGGTSKGAIVLLHDGGGDRHGTVQALRRTLPKLADRFRLDGLPPGIDPPRRHGVELPLKPSQL